jgi:glucosamine--fructose-6-phosphate aminotransferase (isomerizing)
MCGIIGIIGATPVAPRLLEALKRLEYRGYDSAGIATLVNGGIDRRRAEGKLVNLDARLQDSPLDGSTGIGHTRWATHGVPNRTLILMQRLKLPLSTTASLKISTNCATKPQQQVAP